LNKSGPLQTHDQRLLLDLVRNFLSIADRNHQQAVVSPCSRTCSNGNKKGLTEAISQPYDRSPVFKLIRRRRSVLAQPTASTCSLPWRWSGTTMSGLRVTRVPLSSAGAVLQRAARVAHPAVKVTGALKVWLWHGYRGPRSSKAARCWGRNRAHLDRSPQFPHRNMCFWKLYCQRTR
jgi:hypothetical protein